MSDRPCKNVIRNARDVGGSTHSQPTADGWGDPAGAMGGGNGRTTKHERRAGADNQH